ncbi:hypothetical protein [Variovorax sp. PMC12]|uniref:hypothetical protein n=1 Tax=Variovorax sp. PMC12 TaxID=2126319 RepID=UPI000D1155D9|nr:hypothetical protein [Variovorax sp. PMC12]AVQ84271.1 hypothetical protein C4F17_26820 [Variovorax sp. PMC12]
MRDSDLQWLVQQLIGTAELLGQQMSPTAAALMAEDLSAFPREALDRALRRVRTEHTGKLTPKAVLDRVDEVMGRPAPNEAWAMALEALDERATVVWTSEVSLAWQIARPIAVGGDKVGARMAFLSAYERLVRDARDRREAPEVLVSVGWDGAARDAALDRAVQYGRLGHEAAAAMRGTALELAPPVLNPVALLAGKVEATAQASPEMRRRLTALREELASRAKARAAESAAAVQHRNEAWAARQADAQRRVDERLAAEQESEA